MDEAGTSSAAPIRRPDAPIRRSARSRPSSGCGRSGRDDAADAPLPWLTAAVAAAIAVSAAPRQAAPVPTIAARRRQPTPQPASASSMPRRRPGWRGSSIARAPGEALHPRDDRIRRRPVGLRWRRTPRHLPGQRLDARRVAAAGAGAARGAVPQRGDGAFEDVTAAAGIANERWGQGVCAGDVEQRRLPGPLRHQLRRQPSVHQPAGGRDSRIVAGGGGRGRRRLVDRLRVRRLRRRRVARPLRGRLRRARSGAAAAGAVRETGRRHRGPAASTAGGRAGMGAASRPAPRRAPTGASR